MTSIIQMPPGLRRQVFQHFQRLVFKCNNNSGPTTKRAFSNGFILSRQNLTKGAKKPRPPPRIQPPSVTINNPKAELPYAESLLQGNNQVLIYASPNHNALFFSSYLIGGAFLFGAYNWAQFALKERPSADGEAGGQAPKQPWYIKAVLTVEIFVVVALGTHFILTPSKLIKSISIVKAAAEASTSASTSISSSPFLRLEVRRAVPFLKPDVLETPSSNIFLDRSVVTAGEDISFFSVPRSQAEQFTSSYFSGSYILPSANTGGVTGALRSVWPVVRRETRRMFLRDQMAYVRTLDNGRFKLDLQGAAILDDARALDQVVGRDHEKRASILGFIRSVTTA